MLFQFVFFQLQRGHQWGLERCIVSIRPAVCEPRSSLVWCSAMEPCACLVNREPREWGVQSVHEEAQAMGCWKWGCCQIPHKRISSGRFFSANNSDTTYKFNSVILVHLASTIYENFSKTNHLNPDRFICRGFAQISEEVVQLAATDIDDYDQ